jgi:hypothetical protein
MKEDEAIEEIRRVRRAISRECDDDPHKLVQHYIERQKSNANRLRQPTRRSTRQSQ